MEAQTNAQDLQEKIKSYLETLMLETDQARKSEVMQRYLEFTTRFHQYSANNIWLILMTRPDATHVAGYQTWKKMNRWVKKGERGIPIFAPMIHKEYPDKDDSPKILSGFRVVHVFDIAQTEGEPLPPVPDWKSLQKNDELNQKLIKFAEDRGVSVIFTKQQGEVQGVSIGGRIEVDPRAGTKTLIHEIAHELMHRDNDCTSDRGTRELQAEAVGYVVARHFGLEELQSPNYLALYGNSSRELISSIAKIQATAIDIIDTITKNELDIMDII